jgi:O-antigen/teichoic acid export membrane protein
MPDPAQHDRPHPEPGGFFSREAVSGVPWMVLGKLILFFVYFGVSILTVNGLGRDKFGIYSLMTNIASYLLVLCGLGLGAAMMRYVPELAAHRNHRGLIHLLLKSAVLQIAATGVCAALLLFFSGPLQRLFNVEQVPHFRFYLMLVCGLVGLLLLKDFVATVYTSLFRTRTVALLSTIQGVIWLVVLSAWLMVSPEISTVLFVQMISIALVYAGGAALLARHVRRLDWLKLSYGIGRRRTLKFSGTAMLSAILRTVMFKYSEIFFLAFAGGTTLVGMYDLGYTLPHTLVTFFPLALLGLFTAAFAEAYVRDNSCLERLISSYYKLLIMVSLPMAVAGIFFAPEAYRIIYQGEMNEAGRLASVFSAVLLLPLISIPLSVALKAKEKVHNMLPLMLLQIAVNLTLDWLLIVHLRMGVWGGVWAVLGTFLITIVPRLYVARNIIGGIYFPVRFFLRNALALVLEAGVLFWLARQFRLFERFEHHWANIGLLFAVGLVYLILFLVSVRVLRLVRKSDIADFHALHIPRLNRMLSRLFGI